MKKLKTLLWLDDLRNPRTQDWLLRYAPEFLTDGQVIWVKSYDEFIDWINNNGLPSKIAFDNDLGDATPDEKEGYDCAKFIVEYCMDNNTILPDWTIQSANPVARVHIDSLLRNYLKNVQ